MARPEPVQEKINDKKETAKDIKDPLDGLKKKIDSIEEGAILCKSKENNPNYLSISYANKKFYEDFGITKDNLIGKNYDFLFADFDVDYASDEELEFIRLIKEVTKFEQCSIIVDLDDHKDKEKKKFKITFNPLENKDEKSRFAIFTFEKIENILAQEGAKPPGYDKQKARSNNSLSKNLERTLRKERLLREIGGYIISDLPIKDIAQNISKLLCEHLRVDRCLVHDYKEGLTSFVEEYKSPHNESIKPIFKDDKDEDGLKNLAKYINFQNHFYQKHGDKEKRSSFIITEDVSSDSNFLEIEDLCKKFSISSQIAVTTTFNGKVNGGIYIHQAEKRGWLPDEIDLIETVADQYSIALDRSDSIEKVMIANHALMEKTMQLKEALKEEQNIRKMQNEFVALVSHEFKTPLQIIDSTRELLTRKLKSKNVLDEAVQKSFDKIKSGIQRMNGLIHSTLNLAQMESGQNKIKLAPDFFDMKKFVSDVIEKNSELAQNKNIKLAINIEQLPKKFYADSKLLDHAFTNIISNAIKYSKKDTTVKIIGKANDKKMALKVTDQGIGIPKDDVANIGKKFFRAKNTLAVAGTGIGIYLTKHFIELHKGSVLIDSKINVGTSVTAVIPVTKK